MRAWLGALLAVGMLACSSSVDGDEGGGGGCTDITGNYKLVATKQSGSCTTNPNGHESEGTITFGKNEEGFYVLLPGLDGNCPGTLDSSTCRFTAECRFFDKDDAAKTIGTFNTDYVFSGKTFSGSMNAGFSPPAVDEACSELETHSGTRL